MKKLLLLIILPYIFFSALQAQITWQEADKIVSELLNKETRSYILYAEGYQYTFRTIGIWDYYITPEARFILDYPGWHYCVQYYDESGRRYLIVKESNGALLEKPLRTPYPLHWIGGSWTAIATSTSFLIAQDTDISNEFMPRQNLVIRTKEEWKNLLDSIKSTVVNRCFIETDIDFSKYQVIAVISKKANAYLSIDITDITENADEIIVTVSNLITNKYYTMVPGYRVQPFQIVKIPVSHKPVIFNDLTE